jgi:hypothetical protein
MNQWLIENKLVFFFGINPWIDTKNSKSSQRCKNNIRHCAMNIKMSFLWKKMFSTQQPTIGGIPQGWLMKLDFKSLKISSIFGIFMLNNGEDL